MLIITLMIVAATLFAHFSYHLTDTVTYKKKEKKSIGYHSTYPLQDNDIRKTRAIGNTYQIKTSLNLSEDEQHFSRFNLKRRLVGNRELLVDEE